MPISARTRHVIEAPKPEPPTSLSPDQARIFRELIADLPPRWVRSFNLPVLVELVRHVNHANWIAAELERMHERAFVTAEKREIFLEQL